MCTPQISHVHLFTRNLLADDSTDGDQFQGLNRVRCWGLRALQLCSYSQRRGKRSPLLPSLRLLSSLCLLLLLCLCLCLCLGISCLRSTRVGAVAFGASLLTAGLRTSSVGGTVGGSSPRVGVGLVAALQGLRFHITHVSASSCDFIS